MNSPSAGTAKRAANSPVVDRLARVGFAARGTTYLLMGWIALQIGLGHHPRTQANQRGAFQELAQQSYGSLLLWLMVIGLASYAVFRATNAIWGERGESHGAKKWAKRVGSAGRAIAYAVLAYGAWAVLEHRNSSAGVGSGAGLMKHDYGRWLVGAVGVGFMAGGAALVVTGLTRRFKKHLKLGEMSEPTRKFVLAVGFIGTTARGVVFAVIGWFFFDAARTFDAKEAKGLDQNLRHIVQQGGGRAILVGLGLGLIVFGVYSWCEARWRRTGKEGSMTGPPATTPVGAGCLRVADPVAAPRAIAVVFNPSKASDPAKTKRDICDALLAGGFPQPAWFDTTAEEPGTLQCRQAVRDGAGLVLVSGGDGTVAACVTALAGSDVPLAVLPAGTGNLLARNFAIPQKLPDAVRVAAGGVSRRIDVGVVGDRRFAIMAGMGFDAEMLDSAPEKLKAKVGWPAYVVSAARHLRDQQHTFTLTLDDAAPRDFRGRGVLVGNVGKLQGGLPVLPDAVPDDGLLDVAVIRPKSLVGWALLAVSVVLRRGGGPRLETFQASSVVVECDDKVATELDGEVTGQSARLEVSLEPRSLLLRVPG